jgi:hypothetical protein
MDTNNAPAVLERPDVGRLEPLRPMPVHAVQRAMSEYQEGLHAILAETDWQRFVTKTGEREEFPKRSGWRKVATWFGLDLLVDESRMRLVRDANGKLLEAIVVGRVVAPNGRAGEDVGACSHDERFFNKPVHDIIATAATRALNRATANLVGMGALSGEEVAIDVEPLLPEWAQAADEQTRAQLHDKLSTLLGSTVRADAVVNTIDARYEYVPFVLARFVDGLHAMLAPELAMRRADAPPTPTPDETQGATPA